jgi:ribosomal protein S18 acetylase RimI-like enzyme
VTLSDENPRIVDVPYEQRASLEGILEESFEGWYLRHSKKTLAEIETVKAAIIGDRPVGLVMLKTLNDTAGYVYYVAVARDFRRKKIGSTLLDHSLEHFLGLGMKEVYASIENDNVESAGLFRSRAFEKTSYGEVSNKHGTLRAINMYRQMVVVPGEILLFRQIGAK